MNFNSNNIIYNNITSNNAKINSIIIDNSLKTNGTINLSNSFYINNHKIGIKNPNPNYNLDIIGDINYTGNIYNNGLKINIGSYNLDNFNTSLWSPGNSGKSIWNNKNVGIGTSSPKYMLDVVGNTNINGNLFVSNNITANDTIYSSSLIVNNLISAKMINIIDDIVTTGNIFGDNLKITSSIICSSIICNKYNVTENAIFFSDVLINGNVTINGYTNILGNLSINNNKFTVNSTTGDVYVDKSLTVNSSIYITNSLLVNGIATFTNTLYTGNVVINGNLLSASTADATFGNINGNILTCNNISIDNNNIYIYSTDDENTFYINYTTSSYNPTSGALVINGGVGISGDLNISGNFIGSNSTIIYCSEINLNNITCYANAQISGNLSTNYITCNSIIASSISTAPITNSIAFNVDYNANITTTGTCTINGISAFNNDVTITGNLTVTGITILESYYTFKSFTTTGDLTAGQLFVDDYNFYVDSTTQNVYINYSTPSTSIDSGSLIVDGGVGISGDLNVGGNITGNINSSSISTLSNGLILNSKNIILESLIYNITDSNSNIFYIIDDNTINNKDNITIDINSTKIGTYFKFLINCNVIKQIIISVNKNLFGMIINNGVYTSISGVNTTDLKSTCITSQICLNNATFGDYLEFHGVDNYFYIKAESSNNNAFVII
jgi:hypothetical protein